MRTFPFLRGRRLLAALAGNLVALGAWAQQGAAPVCVQDESVQERFLPVELLTGHPMAEREELVLAPVDRVYPFVDILPDGKLAGGDVHLKGPVAWVGDGGVEYLVYERKVPRAFERYALTADKTAMGRVYDQRSGNITNEGKHPVGWWKQGQKRSYSTSYGPGRHGTTSLEIEKLSCTYEGVPGAFQYRFRSDRGLDYGYIYVPTKGLVQVHTHKSGR